MRHGISMVTKTLALLLLASMAGLPVDAAAGSGSGEGSTRDWPQVWGPSRDAKVPDQLSITPETRLSEVWRQPLGKGYSEIVVARGRGYTLLSDGETDHLLAFDFATGEAIWRVPMAETFRGRMGSEDGPLSSPVVVGEKIFALDPFGRLFAFESATGKRLWIRDLAQDLAGEGPSYGYATSPLPVGQNLVVQVGGSQNNVVALAQASGETVWTSKPTETNSYASPSLVEMAGQEQVINMTTDRLFGLDPENGSTLWAHPLTGGPYIGPTILPDNRIVVSSWGDTVLLEVARGEEGWTVDERWRTPTFKASYSPVVHHGGHLYGMDRTYLSCVDLETGEVLWKHKVYEAILISIGDHLAVLGQKSGRLQLVEAAPEGFREVARATVFTPGARTVTGPSYAAGRFLVRNGEEMVQLELIADKADSSATKTETTP